MDAEKLSNYAKLIVEKGLNLDRGQQVLVIAGLDQIEFVRTVVEMCYQAGASRVVVEWEDMPIGKLAQNYQSEKTLSEVTAWELAKLKWRADELPALLWLDSDDPDGMNGIDQGKRARAQMARFPVIKPYRDAAEVAAALDLSRAQLYVAKSRCLKMLRAIMAEYERWDGELHLEI